MGGDKNPRSHAEAAGAGNKNCTLAELSNCAYMESCSHRKQLPESIKNCNPLLSGRNDAVDESAPTTKKRIKIDEKAEENSRRVRARNVLNLQSEGFRSSVSASGIIATHDSNEFIWDSEGSGEWIEMNENGDGGSGRKDANVIKWPMFKNLGGMSRLIWKLKKDVLSPLYQFKLVRYLGVEPMSRILLQGPPGCGKTTLARAVANEAGVPFYEISAAKLVSGDSGACESIRELFSKAYMRAPSIVFIDEIDSFTSKMENLGKEIEPRVVNQLMACMDESSRLIKPVNHNIGSESCHSTPGYVVVIGATNRPDAVDPALRQRFDREILLDVPDYGRRHDILSVLTCNHKVRVDSDLQKVARLTMGFVGRDLAALVKEAGRLAITRITVLKYKGLESNPDYYTDLMIWNTFYNIPRLTISDEEMEKLSITLRDYEGAIRTVQPSSKIKEFYTIPNAKWDDVVGLQLLKQEFDRHIIRPIKFPDVYKDLGMNLTTTIFLYGPSGCGKTMIVEALANEAGANFMHIKCPELLNKYVDHIELVLEKILSNARTWSPCIVFFDEAEAFKTLEGSRVMYEVLGMLECVNDRRGVYIICATNRPIDTQSIMFRNTGFQRERLGKELFDKYMYVPPPNPEERGMILKALSGNKPIDANVNLMAIGKDTACEKLSGADLSTLMKEAVLAAIDRPTVFDGGCRTPWTIKDENFKRALKKISPTVSPMSMEDYMSFSKGIDGAKFCDGRMKT